VVLKDRTTLGLTVWRRVFVHEAQTKGVREDDIVAVYVGEATGGWRLLLKGRESGCLRFRIARLAETFLAPPARIKE
jgi:hypothetical protein